MVDISTAELTATSETIHDACQEARKAQDTIKDQAQAQKNYQHCCELYGAYYAVVRLLGVLDDNKWQEFLAGDN